MRPLTDPPTRGTFHTHAIVLAAMLALGLAFAGCGSSDEPIDSRVGDAQSADELGDAKITMLKKEREFQPGVDQTMFTLGHPDYEVFRVDDTTTSDIIPGTNARGSNGDELQLMRADLGYSQTAMRASLSGKHVAVEWDVADALLRQFQDVGYFRYGKLATSQAHARNVFATARTPDGREKYPNCLIVEYRGQVTVLFPPVAEEGRTAAGAHFDCFRLSVQSFAAVWNSWQPPEVGVGHGSGSDGVSQFRNDSDRLDALANRDRANAANRAANNGNTN